MRAPQIIMIVIFALGLFISLENHGKPKQGTDNFFLTLLGTAINIALLWWGGFWG